MNARDILDPEHPARDFSLLINYDVSIEELRKVICRPTEIVSDVNSDNLPCVLRGQKKVDLQLLSLWGDLSTRKILTAFSGLYVRPANTAELLFFGIANPFLLKESNVVALGSSIKTDGRGKEFPYLGWGYRPFLRLVWDDGGSWGLLTRKFLVVKEKI